MVEDVPEVALAVVTGFDEVSDATEVGFTATVEETAVGAAWDVPVRD